MPKLLEWINSHRLKFGIAGTLCLLISIGFGVWWALGADMEPIAFLFLTASSVLFGIPYAAELLTPKSKPIRDMTSAEKLATVESSHPTNDWIHVSPDQNSREYYFREDSQLRIFMRFTNEGVQCENFQEDWANQYPDRRATGYWVNVTYAGQLIERVILVAVDGARAELPAPRPSTLIVSRLNYKVAQINDIMGSLDQYMRSSGLSLEP